MIAPDVGYVLPPFPGLWQPTPPGFSPPTFTFYPDVRPFGLLTSTQFLPPPPPTLNSERYATDFNEVKQLGAAASALRTAEETLLAELFAGVNTTTTYIGVWNNVARDVAIAQGLSLVDTARLFALMNVSFHDGLQTSFTSKFAYRLWRPVTAVRLASEDLNDATEADPDWAPLLTTPPYPIYAGNAACLAAASARSVALILGRDDVTFSVTWCGPGGCQTKLGTTPPFPNSWRRKHGVVFMEAFISSSIPTPAWRFAPRSRNTFSLTSCGHSER